MHSRLIGNHIPSPPTRRSTSANDTNRPLLDSLRRSLVPSRSSCAVALCWVAWFVCHVAIRGEDRLLASSASVRGDVGERAKHRRRPNLIEGKIVRGLPTHGLHADGSDVEYRCRPGEVIHRPKAYRLWGGLNGTRQPLAYPLNASGLFDFAAHVSKTRLRILIVGNSLGEQLHAGMEEAMCFPVNMTAMTTPSDRKLFSKQSTCRTNFAGNDDGQWIKEPRIVLTRSGGMIGVVKDNTHMIDGKTNWMRNNTAISSLQKAIGDEQNFDNAAAEKNAEKKRLLDVFVYQFQSGHVDLRDFDEYYLEQAVSAASDFFGATTVIFPTIAWMNNIDSSRVDKWREVNDRIRNFARSYSPRETSTVDSVHVLEFAELSRLHIEANAKILGIHPDETYELRLESLWTSLVAQMCASLPFVDDPRGCLPGMVSNDGMHLCPETFHGRVNAALVCLLDCKFNRRPTSPPSACSDGCNSRYMNLDSIKFTLNEDLKEEMSLTL